MVAAALLASSACGGRGYPEYQAVEVEPRATNLPFRGGYGNIVWLGDSEPLVFLSTEIGKSGEIDFFDVNDGTMNTLWLGNDPRCARFTRYLGIKQLPDKRLGLLKFCGRDASSSNDVQYLVAYDWHQNALQEVVQGPLIHIMSGDYAWNPDMTRGIQVTSNGLDASIYWLTPNGAEPITATITDGPRSWLLSENWRDPMNPVRTDLGLPGHVAWSPDGHTIAFWASIDAIGRSGFNRSAGEWQLYFMNPDERHPSSVLRGMYRPHLLEWSPDSQWLAFLGSVGPKTNALWLFHAVSQTLKLVGRPGLWVRDLQWSPDGTSVAVLRFETLDGEAAIWIYDVSGVMIGPSE